MPSAADVNALQEAKPKVTPEVLSSAKAEAQYNADVEAWGERLSSAGRRLCHWYNDRGGKFKCP